MKHRQDQSQRAYALFILGAAGPNSHGQRSCVLFNATPAVSDVDRNLISLQMSARLRVCERERTEQ